MRRHPKVPIVIRGVTWGGGIDPGLWQGCTPSDTLIINQMHDFTTLLVRYRHHSLCDWASGMSFSVFYAQITLHQWYICLDRTGYPIELSHRRLILELNPNPNTDLVATQQNNRHYDDIALQILRLWPKVKLPIFLWFDLLVDCVEGHLRVRESEAMYHDKDNFLYFCHF